MNTLNFRLAGLCLLLAAFLSGGAAHGQDYKSVNAFPGLTFPNAVCIASPPGESNRLFIVEKHGRISVITNLDNPTRTVFMDISDRITVDDPDEAADVSGEDGLVGLAFHPGYASNGLFYVYYTGPATNGTTDTHDILSSFKVSNGNPNQGDPSSEVRLIVQYDRANNHNGGDLHFGPDGYLYLSLGDEGGANNQFGNAQHIDMNFFSGILRIDVDKHHGNQVPHTNSEFASTTNYAVPSDNPFVGAATFDGLPVNTSQLRTEFWAVGLRNPWRFSFDSATGTLYCGDVGQDAEEEIDVITKGGNYGWATYEGTNPTPGVVTNSWPVPHNPIAPIMTILHPDGEAIIGGVVYHGSTLPGLDGAYIYGDNVTGLMNWLVYDGSHVTSSGSLMNDVGVSAFGIDPSSGDVLYCNLQNGNDSIIKRIVPVVSGSLQVTINPPDAVTAGAKWRVGSGPFQNSGTILSNLSVGNFTVSYKSVSGFTTPASQTVAITTNTTTVTNGTYVSTDTTRPTATITFPKAKQDLSNGVATATGTAKDKSGVAEVWVQLNGAGWVQAGGTTAWSAPGLNLTPGANTLQAYAVDTTGNISTTNSVSFIYGVRVPVTVNTTGQGTFSPNLNGQMLEIGKTFSMTAKPTKGSAFTNWSGSIATNKTKLTFVMASNLTFTANFIDVTRPIIAILFPKKNFSTNGATITATGKASDNVGVASVFYQINGTGWNPAVSGNGWTNWTAADLELLSGMNELDAWAADAAGHHSLTNTVLFSHVVTASADWAPDSLSGLIAQVTPSGESSVNMGFDLATFSQTGETNEDFALGVYSYNKLATNEAQLILTNTAPPTQTNSGVVVDLMFTNHYAGVFSNQFADTGSIQLSIATNLLPASLAGKSIVAIGASAGSHTTTLKFGKSGTLTKTPSNSGAGAASTATYTFTRFSPVSGLLTVAFTGPDLGTTAELEITFTSKNAGNYFVETFDNTGTLQDADTGTFVFH